MKFIGVYINQTEKKINEVIKVEFSSLGKE